MGVIVQGGKTVIGKRRLTLIPNIITDGLVLNLDAGNILSYPGSGTDWFDLTTNNNDGVLTNGPTYDGTSLVFDGLDDYVIVGASTDLVLPNNTTMEFWVNSDQLNSNDIISHKFNCYGAAHQPTYAGGVSGKLSIYYSISGWKSVSTTTTVVEGSWYHLVGSYDGSTMRVYLNGVLENTRDISGNITQGSGTPLGIGTFVGSPSAYAWDGKISTTRYYHKTLTDGEVLQNYNATKSRFGL